MSHLSDYHIGFKKPKDMRYAGTAGDYFEKVSPFGKPLWAIEVCHQKNKDYEFLVAVHEFVELCLTQREGIKEEDIKKFDLEHLDADEPGELPDAPYFKEHAIATEIEHRLADYLGIDWEEYNFNLEISE